MGGRGLPVQPLDLIQLDDGGMFPVGQHAACLLPEPQCELFGDAVGRKTAMWELAGRRIKTYLRTANTRHEARGVLFTSRCIGVGFSDRPEDR